MQGTARRCRGCAPVGGERPRPPPTDALLSGTVERSQTALDDVPAGSRRRAGVIFTKDPAEYRLRLRPVGWEQP